MSATNPDAKKEFSPEFLQEMEKFYENRAIKALSSQKRTLEARLRIAYDAETSRKLESVCTALEAIS